MNWLDGIFRVTQRALPKRVRLTITPYGPDRGATERATEAILRHEVVRARLEGTKYRLLSARPIGIPPSIEVIVYDYTNDIGWMWVGSLADELQDAPVEHMFDVQPPAGEAEFREAVGILKRLRPELAHAISTGEIVAHPEIPSAVALRQPDGRRPRRVVVGVTDIKKSRHDVVLVDVLNEVLEDAPQDTDPPTPPSCDQFCGQPLAESGCSWEEVQGGLELMTEDCFWFFGWHCTELWKFKVERPRASSGINGSCIEIHDVRYRKKNTLERAHIPIVTLRHGDGQGTGCAISHRSTLRDESCFHAEGEDKAPGFRKCSAPPQTILLGTDRGNFSGVAFYWDADDFVLVSEVEDGWLRYVLEWRFHKGGELTPRVWIKAVEDCCACDPHEHHVYWRFAFNFGYPVNVEELSDGTVTAVEFEKRRQRSSDGRRLSWRILNDGPTKRGYELIPGDEDGPATNGGYGAGDLWFLAFKDGAEIDDGVSARSGEESVTRPRLDQMVNSERIRHAVSADKVVVWYAAHFSHGPGGCSSPALGPRLRKTGDW